MEEHNLELLSINELRTLTGVSQSKFAKMFHIPVGTLAHWEQGIRKPPEYVVYMMNYILFYNKDISEKEE